MLKNSQISTNLCWDLEWFNVLPFISPYSYLFIYYLFYSAELISTKIWRLTDVGARRQTNVVFSCDFHFQPKFDLWPMIWRTVPAGLCFTVERSVWLCVDAVSFLLLLFCGAQKDVILTFTQISSIQWKYRINLNLNRYALKSFCVLPYIPTGLVI